MRRTFIGIPIEKLIVKIWIIKEIKEKWYDTHYYVYL